MSTKTKVIATVIVFTTLAMMLNVNAPLGAMVFGTPPAGGAEPTGPQIGALMVVATLEAVAFGVGIAFLLFGLPIVRAVVPRPGVAVATWLFVSWLLASWVPHSALHQTAGDNFAKLIAIEYTFHVTLVLGGMFLAWTMVYAARVRKAAGLRADGPIGPGARA